MEYKDYYNILGVSRDANDDQIRRSYRRLARKYHPDVSSEPDAEKRFKEAAEAYEVLKDPEKRNAYDTLGPNWQAGQEFRPPPGWNEKFSFQFSDPGAAPFSEFFRGLFQGNDPTGFAHTGGFQMPQQEQTIEITATLEQLYSPDPLLVKFRTAAQDSQVSPRGTTKTLRIKIPPGVRDGGKFRLKGQGPNNSDLICKLAISPHAEFTLQGDDVCSTIPITPWDAALGTTMQVRTLGGEVQLKIPSGSSSGRKMRLKNRGLDNGHHVATLRIEVPTSLTAEEREAFEKLRGVSEFSPRR